MIDAWYFCSSVQAGPTVVAAYLSVLRTIRSPRVGAELATAALEELLRAEPVLRHYAVPDVMAAGLRGEASPGVVVAARRVLADTLDAVDQEVARRVLMAWDALQARGRTEEVLVPLRQAMQRARELRRPQPAEPTPYLHVEDHLAETVLLALCVRAGRRGADLAQGLAEDDEARLLVRLGLENAAGRQGLLLAAEAAVLLGEDMPSQRTVEKALLDPTHGAALWEPDLLGALARVVFGYPNVHGRSRTSAHGAVVDELVLFTQRIRWEREHRRPTAAAGEALGRLGLDTEPNDMTGLVLWQAVLWQLAADLDASATTAALTGHWLPPYNEISGTVRVVVPIPDRARGAWDRRIKALAQLRLTDQTRWNLYPRNGALRISSPFAVVALSPWLTRSSQRAWEFPREQDGLALLRLMAAASCAADLLETPTHGDAQHLLALTLHAWEVLDGGAHGKWVRHRLHHGSSDGLTPSMSAQLSGLALFVWRRVKRIGAGETEQVTPGAITEYLLPQDVSSGEAPIRSQALRRSFDFVHDGLSGSIPGLHGGQGRWRESADERGRSHAARVLQELSSLPREFDSRRASALLRVHFDIHNSRAPALSRSLRGLNGREPNPWVVLAAKPLEDSELESPELVHCLDRQREDDLSFLLAVATARLHAVISDAAVADGRYGGWLDEWRHLVATVSETRQLPRPLRLFMLELLGRPLAGTGPEARAMEDFILAEVEFGLGTPLDRWTLFQRLGGGSWLPADFAQFLRLQMLRALYFFRTRSPRHRDIRDPSEVLRDATSDALLERLLVRFILDVGQLPGELAGASVAEMVPRLWREVRQPADLRELQVDLGAGDESPDWLDLDRRLLVGAAVDPVTDQLRVHLRRRPPLRTAMRQALLDGWSISAERLRERLEGAGSTSVVGVVAAQQVGRTWVNVGLEQPLLWERSLDGTNVGDMVAVTVESLAGGLRLVRENSVEPLGTTPNPGDVEDATVAIDRRQMPATVTVRVAGESFELDREQPEWVRRRWMPDLVDLLTGELGAGNGGVLSYPAVATREADRWLPMDLGQRELFAYLAGSGRVRLVVVGGVGTDAARYSIAPGHNVVLPHGAWTDGARAQIEQALRSLGTDAHGLVLDARVEMDADQSPRLTLDGERPLDDRAQQWRRVFDDAADFEARLDPESGRFTMESDVPGFPRIAVEVDAGDTVCRFTPRAWTDWEQRRAEVDGELSPHRRLEVGEPSIDMLRRLLDLDEGDVVKLDRILLKSPPRRAARRGWTTKGLTVDVEAEALHFGELGTDHRTASPFVRNRPAVVTRVRPLRPRGSARQAADVPDPRLLESVTNRADKAAAEDHLLRAATLRGLVIDAPERAQHDDDLFRVWLDVGGVVIPITLYRREFEHPPERQGALVRAWRVGGEAWRFTAHGRYIQVRPLWKLVEGTEPPPPGAISLGVIGWNQSLWMLSQLPLRERSRNPHPALHIHPLQGGTPAAHLAERRLDRGSGGRPVWRGAAYRLADGQVEVHDRVDGGRRAVVNIDLGKGRSIMLAGEVRGNGSVADARVDRVQMSMSQLPSGDVVARRLFVLSEQDYGREESAPPGQQPDDDELAGYRDYWAGEQFPLPARLDDDGRHVTLRTGWKVPIAGGAGFRVPLAAGEAPWVDHRYTDSEVQVMLLEEAGRLVASYRQVPPLELAEAVPLFQRQGMIPGARWEPRQRLYYVDRRVTAAGVVHRFEWGYGYTLQVPEHRMTIGGHRAPGWPMTPFHGDWIRELLISDAGGGRGPQLDIAIDAIDAGWLSHIYADAGKGVITPADIEAAGDGTNPKIAAVYARWRRYPGATERYRDDQRVQLKGLRLSEPAAEAITDAWQRPGGTAADGPRRAFLRLNRKRFEESGGRRAEFDFVRPELGGENGLDTNALVFLEAGEIELLPNDVQLLLHPGKVLGQRGQGFTVKVRRRDFSQRQNLLRELYASDDPGPRRGRPVHRSQALAGDVYLVRLGELHTDKRWAGGRIRDGLYRPVPALRGHVLANDAPCLASVQPRQNGFTLEIRPNVLFLLERSNIASYSGTGDGAIVRVTAERGATTRRGRFVLQPVLRGDGAYVPAEGRPALLLPKQDLLNAKDDLDGALRRGSYTVAGLPSLTIPGIPRASAQGEPAEPDDFARSLLMTAHPKIATIRVEQADRPPGATQVQYGPPDADVLAGRLVLRDDDTLGCRDLGDNERRIPWSSVSYADEGTDALRSRCKQRWQYHDLTTSHRSPAPPHRPAEPRRLARNVTAIEEPVFFSEGWALRHPDRTIRRYGFSAAELLESRADKRKRRTYPVASVSWRGGKATGIWIEQAPGRVVELAGAMLATNDTGQLPLDKVDWSHFASGDLVTLQVRRGHQLEIGSVGLRAWRPGPRGAFGPRTLLPVLECDQEHGTLLLGAGLWTVRHPLEPDATPPQVDVHVWLDNANAVTVPEAEPAGRDMRAGDVVLLGFREGRLHLLGLEWAVPALSEDGEGWAPWLREALTGPGAAALLELCGGALPVTVEAVDGTRVTVSRRSQLDAQLPPGASIPVVPLGMMDGWVILRAGSRLHRCPLEVLVPGLPASIAAQALDRLRAAPDILWLTCPAGDELHIGLPDPSRGEQPELRAALLAAIGEDADAGVLCWDASTRRPRWLPARAVGWIAPTPVELECWVSAGHVGHREIALALCPDGTLSVVDTAVNRQRLAQLRVGDPLRVEVLDRPGVPQADGRLAFLGRVYLTELLVELRIAPDALRPEPDRPRFCEVERRLAASRGADAYVRVCDLDARLVRMAVPDGPADVRIVDQRIVRLASRAATGEPGEELVRELAGAVREWAAVSGDQLFGPELDKPLDAAPALAMVVALARLGDCPGPVGVSAARAAVHACRQLGLRAAASRHLDPMLDLWLGAVPGTPRTELWRRLDEVPLGGQVDPAQVDRVRALHEGIRGRTAVRDEPDLRLLSSCIAASAGVHQDYDDIDGYEGLTGKLNALGRALAPHQDEMVSQCALIPEQRAHIAGLLDAAERSPRTLMPLPSVLQDPGCRREAAALHARLASTDWLTENRPFR